VRSGEASSLSKPNRGSVISKGEGGINKGIFSGRFGKKSFLNIEVINTSEGENAKYYPH